jgi:zinc transport system substrate-binding protein
MVPPGANVHIYEPTPSQMTALARAEMYASVGSGVEFELVWMDKLVSANREMLVIDCSAGVTLQAMTELPAGQDDRGAPDPHIWMSPRNVPTMIRNIYQGLVRIDPENEDLYARNRDAYIQKLDELDREIREALSAAASRQVMVYHPAFGYFAHEYGITMIPIEEGGKEPTAAGLERLIEQAKRQSVRVIFAEPQFDPRSAEVIAESIEGRVVLVDPLARDYVDNMRRLLVELVQAMR